MVAVLLAALAALVYGRGLAGDARRAGEGAVEAEAASLAESGLDDGRRFPLFIHVEDSAWLPAAPVYATAALISVAPGGSTHARLVAAAWGVLDVALLYLLVVRYFGSSIAAAAAALALIATPAHTTFSRAATVEGIWVVPLILAWAALLTVLRDPPSPRARWLLALGAASLGASVYTQPSAALTMAMFLSIGLAAFRLSRAWTVRDVVPAGAALLFVLLPVPVWYAMHPQTYPDTLGRWLVHPAHLRNPLVWARAAANWNTDSNVAALFWDFLAPSHVFLSPSAPGYSGLLLTAIALPCAVGVLALCRRRDPDGVPAVIRLTMLAGLLVGPLAAAMFGHARSDDRALVFVPFALAAAAWGGSVMWTRGGWTGRSALVAAGVGTAIQAYVCAG
jgi:hypothetical protein